MYSTVFAFLLRPAIGSRAPTRSIRACLEPSSSAVREDEGLLSSSPRDREGAPESQIQPPCRKGSMWPSPCNLVETGPPEAADVTAKGLCEKLNGTGW